MTDDAAAEGSGVERAAELLAFAEAAVVGEPGPLDDTRGRLLAAVGPEGLVDAAAVVANFERMVRIADSTGIPLDAPVAAMTSDLREELDLRSYGSAANTPEPGVLMRAGGAVLRRVAPRLLGLAAKGLARRSGRQAPP